MARQEAVVRAVLAGAQGSARDPAAAVFLPPDGSRELWYKVILTGFNVIDDACISYIDNLWIIERRKLRNSTILHAASGAGAALLSAQVTPQTAAALLVLTTAFGFAGVLNNAMAESYLYSQNAATIKQLVQKTTAGYRADFATKTLNVRDEVAYPVASPGAAYHHMRQYLALCLPPTIQAQIEVLVGKAIAIPDDLFPKINPVPVVAVPAPTAPSLSPTPRSGRVLRGAQPTTSMTF